MVSSSGRMPVERVGFVALIFAAVLYLGSGSRGGSSYASMRQLEDVQLSLAGANGAPFPGHILVTGGAGFIGSHATLRLLEDGYAVTIVDNYSRGNRGAIEALRKLAPKNKLRVVDGDLGWGRYMHPQKERPASRAEDFYANDQAARRRFFDSFGAHVDDMMCVRPKRELEKMVEQLDKLQASVPDARAWSTCRADRSNS